MSIAAFTRVLANGPACRCHFASPRASCGTNSAAEDRMLADRNIDRPSYLPALLIGRATMAGRAMRSIGCRRSALLWVVGHLGLESGPPTLDGSSS